MDVLAVGDAVTRRRPRRGARGDRRRLLPDPLDGAAGGRGASPAASGRRERFAAARRKPGVQRIVYLGGLVPARRAVVATSGERLTSSRSCSIRSPSSIVLRASIVIGARSRSFRFLVRLVERMPVLALPAWRVEPHASPSTAATCSTPRPRGTARAGAGGRSLDIAGPDVMSYAEHDRADRGPHARPAPALSLGVSPTPSRPRRGRGRRRAPGADRAADGGARARLLPRDDRRAAAFGVRLHGSTRRSSARCATGSATRSSAAR